MWVKQAGYLALIERAAKAEASVEWLRVRVNALEREGAEMRARITGVPAVAATVGKPISPEDLADRLGMGIVNFDVEEPDPDDDDADAVH